MAVYGLGTSSSCTWNGHWLVDMSEYMWIFAFDGVEQLLTFRIHQYLGHVGGVCVSSCLHVLSPWKVSSCPKFGNAKNSTTLEDEIRTPAWTPRKRIWSSFGPDDNHRKLNFKRTKKPNGIQTDDLIQNLTRNSSSRKSDFRKSTSTSKCLKRWGTVPWFSRGSRSLRPVFGVAAPVVSTLF